MVGKEENHSPPQQGYKQKRKGKPQKDPHVHKVALCKNTASDRRSVSHSSKQTLEKGTLNFLACSVVLWKGIILKGSYCQTSQPGRVEDLAFLYLQIPKPSPLAKQVTSQESVWMQESGCELNSDSQTDLLQ
jgi:hypothetical protein